MPMEINELLDNEILCKYCPCTDFGEIDVNTGPHNLCEGRYCNDAYKSYLDDMEEEI
jgi:hypothetical protein